MSCEYEIACRTCKVAYTLEPSFRGMDACAVVALAPALIALKRACEAVNERVRRTTVGAHYGYMFGNETKFEIDCGSVDVEWFVTHEGHDLVARTEYGEELPNIDP